MVFSQASCPIEDSPQPAEDDGAVAVLEAIGQQVQALAESYTPLGTADLPGRIAFAKVAELLDLLASSRRDDAASSVMTFGGQAHQLAAFEGNYYLLRLDVLRADSYAASASESCVAQVQERWFLIAEISADGSIIRVGDARSSAVSPREHGCQPTS